MTRSFDTGLATPQRTALRNGVIAMLQPLLKANGGYLRTIKPVAMPMRGAHDEDFLGELARQFQGQAPGIAVALGRKDYVPMGTEVIDGGAKIAVAIYVISASPRSVDEGRLSADVVADADPTADPGIEVMLEDVEQLILGQETDVPSLYELRPSSEDHVTTAADVSIWEQRYTVELDKFINPDRAITVIVTSIEADNNLSGADPANPIVTTITDLEAP